MENEVMIIIKEVLDMIAPYVISGIATLLVLGVNKGVEYLKDRLASETANKYLELAEKTVTDCVMATNQTYVDSLKNNGAFDKEAWTTAFEKSKNKVLKLLSEAQKEVIVEVYGDLETWVNTQIECKVKELKNKDTEVKALMQPTSQVVNISQAPTETIVKDVETYEVSMGE